MVRLVLFRNTIIGELNYNTSLNRLIAGHKVLIKKFRFEN